jgi:hypothetical protein
MKAETMMGIPVVSAMDGVDSQSSRLGIEGETTLDLTSAPQVEFNN